MTWQAVFLVLKGGGDFWAIGFMGFLWKMVIIILYFRLGAFISLHDVLHGLRYGCGAGTASPKANSLQQLKVMREEVL